jgi:hypothetical protein
MDGGLPLGQRGSGFARGNLLYPVPGSGVLAPLLHAGSSMFVYMVATPVEHTGGWAVEGGGGLRRWSGGLGGGECAVLPPALAAPSAMYEIAARCKTGIRTNIGTSKCT